MNQIGWAFKRKKDEKSGRKGIIALFSFVLIFLVLIAIALAIALPLASALPSVSATSGNPGVTVGVNFADNIGIVGNNFYGVNVHNSWLKEGRMVDANGEGILNDPSDTAWNRQTFISGGDTYAREDMNLGGFYDGWYNGGAEDWLNGVTSGNTIDQTQVEDLPFGWNLESDGNGGTGARSTSSHSGQYSMSLNTIGGNGEWSWKDVYFQAGHSYNFSVWVKSSYSVSLLIQNKAGGWTDVCSSSSTGSGGWELVSCKYTPSTYVNEGYRLTIKIGGGKVALWDDATLTDNGNPISWWRLGNMTSKLEEYAWAQANGVRILNVISYMPKFLANLSSGCNSASRIDGCAPTDYTKMGEIVKDYVDRSTNNGQYIGIVDYEDWNEPDTGLLGDYASSDQRKADTYVRMHSAIRTALKSAYPNVCIGGTGSSWFEDGPLINSYFSTFKDDCFFSFHIYESPLQVNVYNKMQQYYNAAIADCSAHNANCSRIIISEYNLDHTSGDDLIRNTPSRANEYAADFSLFYASTLNSYPSKISMVAYQWGDQYKFGQNGYFPEFPHQWDMVVEPCMGLEYKPPYNVTKDFSFSHSPGSMIVKSNSSINEVKSVASKKGNKEYITIINTGAGIDVALDMHGLNISGVKDLKTGQVYNATNGYVYVGNIEQFSIRYFTNSSFAVGNSINTSNNTSGNTSNNNTTGNTTTSGGSSSGNVSGSSNGSGSSGGSGGSLNKTNTTVNNTTNVSSVGTSNSSGGTTVKTNTSISNGTIQNNITQTNTSTSIRSRSKRLRTRHTLFENIKIFSWTNLIILAIIAVLVISIFYSSRRLIKNEENKRYVIKYHPER